MGLKDMMGKMYFRPKELQINAENESLLHKSRIIVGSLAMFSIATSYENFFYNMGWRSNQFQADALAGKKGFVDYIPYVADTTDSSNKSQLTWELRNDLSVLKDKSVKELKYIEKDWKDRHYVNWAGRTDISAPGKGWIGGGSVGGTRDTNSGVKTNWVGW
jgi:hypothetical protein